MRRSVRLPPGPGRPTWSPPAGSSVHRTCRARPLSIPCTTLAGIGRLLPRLETGIRSGGSFPIPGAGRLAVTDGGKGSPLPPNPQDAGRAGPRSASLASRSVARQRQRAGLRTPGCPTVCGDPRAGARQRTVGLLPLHRVAIEIAKALGAANRRSVRVSGRCARSVDARVRTAGRRTLLLCVLCVLCVGLGNNRPQPNQDHYTPMRRDRSVWNRPSGSHCCLSARNLVTASSPCTRGKDDSISVASLA